MSTAPAFASASEALAMVRAGLGYLAAADHVAMPAEVQAECLLVLEQNDLHEAIASSSASWYRCSRVRASSARPGLTGPPAPRSPPPRTPASGPLK